MAAVGARLGAGLYEYDPSKVSRDTFVEACAAEGTGVRGNGYAAWHTVPLFQDPKVYGQLWPVQHAGGAAFQPTGPGALPNTEALRAKNLLFEIPAMECPRRMDQVAAGVEKVAANMAALAKRQRAAGRSG